MIIAIDGPSGAGKSTIAKFIAKELGIDYIDTGAMYRAIALKVIRKGINIEDEETLMVFLEATSVDISENRILLDGEDVSAQIRTEGISAQASRVSAIPAVRRKLVALQRGMGRRKSVVMDGRDIGSNVFPDAEYKFYITASPEVRANRRYKELSERSETVNYEDVLSEIEKRDWNDSHRALNPLVKTADAIEIDTDNLNIDEVITGIFKYLQ